MEMDEYKTKRGFIIYTITLRGGGESLLWESELPRFDNEYSLSWSNNEK